MNRKVRIGLIGCGNYGKNLLRFLDKMDCYDVISIADPDQNAARAGAQLLSYSTKLYADDAQLIAARDIDAVIIATPNDQHAEQAIRAMEAGLAVYLEKPIACTIPDCRRVIAAQRHTGARVMVGMQLRYGEVFSKAKELLCQGVIGDVKLLWYREFRGPFFPGADSWRISNEKSGGTIVEKNVHHLDLFNWYADAAPVAVFATGGSDAIYKKSGMLDNAIVTVDYDSGARACVGLSLFSAGCDRDIDFYIVGEHGVMYIGEDTITVKPNTDPTKVVTYKIEQRFADMGHGGTEFSALTAFYALVTRNKAPLTGVYEGLLSVGMALAAQISAAEHREVKLSEITGAQ